MIANIETLESFKVNGNLLTIKYDISIEMSMCKAIIIIEYLPQKPNI